MEKYGVNQSWEGCNRMVQYRASFRYVDYTANDKVIRRDSQTMQYTEYLYLPSNQGADSTCLAGVSAWCQSSSGIAWSPPILSIATTFSPVNQASQVRMIQQRGEMYAGRAQYAVTREQPGIIQRFSTTLATYATDQVSAAWQSTANDVSFYATSSDTGWNRLAGGRGAAVGLSEGDFTTALAAGNANQVCGAAGGAWALLQRFYYSEEPILLRYHLLSPQPGAVKGPTCAPGVLPCPTTTVPATFATRQTPISPAGGGANWVYTGGLWRPSATMYMGVLNMRNRRVTHRIPLEDCGNASVNVTAYEDCDIEHTAGAGLYEYDAGAGSGAYTQLTPGGRGISDYDYALGRAPAPAFWQRATRTYYQCDEICLKQLQPTCPDSRQSNGQDHADLRTPGDAAGVGAVPGVLREACDEGPDRGPATWGGTLYAELWGNYAAAGAPGGPGRAAAAWPLARRREGKTAGCAPTNTCTETAAASAPLDKHACGAV